MTPLNQHHLKAIHKLHQRGDNHTNVSSLVKYCRDNSIGTPHQKTQHFSNSERDFLIHLFHKYYDGDINAPFDSQCHNRYDNKHRREKTGAPPVFAANLIFASISPQAPLPHINTPLPIHYNGYLSTLRAQHCDPQKIHRLIIVENGDMMNQAHQWMPDLPNEWQTALLLYRGQGENQTHVKHLIQQLTPTIPLAIYPDLDPAGMHIAAEYLPRAHALIMPHQNAPTLQKYNDSDTYHNQITNRKTAPNHPTLAALHHWLIQHQLAIMQEKHHHIGKLIALPLIAP